MKQKQLRISDVSARLAVPYQMVFSLITSGKVRAHRDVSGSRWLINAEDLPAIAEALGVITTEANNGASETAK